MNPKVYQICIANLEQLEGRIIGIELEFAFKGLPNYLSNVYMGCVYIEKLK